MYQKKTYEWVFVMSKGDPIYLTENQYDIYCDNWKDGQIFFGKVGINPSFVVQFYKRPAEGLFDMYPCKNCGQNGWKIPEGKSGSDGITEECQICKGTGLDFRT